MRSYISEDATISFFIPEPIRPYCRPGITNVIKNSVWCQVYSLNHPTDGAGRNQFTRFFGGFIFKPLTIHYGVDPFGLLLHFFYFSQLFQRNDTWFISEIIFTMLHYTNAQWRSFIRNTGT